MPDLPPDQGFSGHDFAIVRYVGGEARITLQDAEAMRAAVVEHLRGSSLEERERLVRLTEKAPIWVDADGIVRIGGWLLQARGDELVLTFRQISEAPVSRAYSASFSRADDGWRLEDITEDRILKRQ